MHFVRGSSRSFWAAGLSVVLALFTQGALAAIPPGGGGAVSVALPNINDPAVALNLRQQGAITGSAPMSVDPASAQFFVNGTPTNGIQFGAFPNNGPGHVCLLLANSGNFTIPVGATFEIQITVNNLVGPPARITIPLNNAPGPIFNAASCDDPNTPPVANAGPDRTVADTDGQAGENVVLDGSASSDADPGTVLNYQWVMNDATIGGPSPSPTLTVNLPPGTNTIALIVTDDSGDPAGSGFDNVTITVNAPQAPSVDAGVDRTIADTDRDDGENVALTATATDPDGTIASFQWLEGQTVLGTSNPLNVRLSNGTHVITVVATDNVGVTARDTVQITVDAPVVRATLSELPNLTPNQFRMAQALDRACAALDGRDTPSLNPDQRDLLTKCNQIYFGTSAAGQVAALEALIPDGFAVARTQTLLFANTQYLSVMDRLMALRGGAKGLSLAGLNLVVDGKIVPLAQLQEMAKGLLGGGASADEPGGLLSDKWGLWARGNYSFGDKDRSAASPSFDAKQWTLTGGIDYRLTDKSVLGLALSYGSSTIDFNPSGEGGLDTNSWAVSLYGSMYAGKNFYLDAVINGASSSYDARRNIAYTAGAPLLPVDVDATGNTDGMTLSGGLSAGYDFLIGGLTISPNLGFFYIDTTIDSFTEHGAGGLNFIYDEQKFKSLTGNAGLRLTYAWNLSWGVLLPHLRVDYVREFETDVDVFGVRFASDPTGTSAPPILVATDNPDTSYWRLATGFSAQFKYGVSGYIEYQRLESFQFISFQDVSIGLRLQRSF